MAEPKLKDGIYHGYFDGSGVMKYVVAKGGSLLVEEDEEGNWRTQTFTHREDAATAFEGEGNGA